MHSPPDSRRTGLPSPRRRFGQNFLIDSRAIRRIIAALAPRPDDAVLEIGPGHGALTRPLIDALGKIAAIELDRDLARALRARFDSRRLLLLEGDVLKIDLARVAPAMGLSPATPLAIIGNLPYNISKPLASKLVQERRRLTRAVLTFQSEVAERLTAEPGSRAYGALSVLVGSAFEVKRILDLPPSAFRPRPSIVSTVTLWVPRAPEALSAEMEGRLRACLAAAFAHRRQTVLRNLRTALPGGEAEARMLLDAADIDVRARAESVGPEGFLRLATRWRTAAP